MCKEDEIDKSKERKRVLGDVEIYFNHYVTYEEGGKEKWYSRLKRINWNNLFIMMFTGNRKMLEEFERLGFKKKVCFVPFESECVSAHTISIADKPELQGKTLGKW